MERLARRANAKKKGTLIRVGITRPDVGFPVRSKLKLCSTKDRFLRECESLFNDAAGPLCNFTLSGTYARVWLRRRTLAWHLHVKPLIVIG